jgi:HNH endonuclease
MSSMDDLPYFFNSILTKGKKDNTYKFALARFLVDYTYNLDDAYFNKKMENNTNEIIQFATISKAFLKYYWHQICRYKIKQNYNIEKPPLIVKIIQEIFGKDYNPKPFRVVEKEEKKKIINGETQITKKCFVEVIPRFQNIIDGIHVRSNEIFYEYNNNSISVNPQALRFFRENHTFLYKAIILEWSRFLEKINRGLPMLISKVESDETRRNSLEAPYKILRKYVDKCFYCDNPLSLDRSTVHVDHFIPWAYVFEDEIWNLVLACDDCNRMKRDSLYPSDYIDKIVDRNTKYYNKIEELNKSLLRLDSGMKWEKAIRRHYQNCKDYGFTVINLNV